MVRTLKCDHWKTVEQYFAVLLLVDPFSPVCNLGKFKYGFGFERVKAPYESHFSYCSFSCVRVPFAGLHAVYSTKVE